MKKKNGFTLAEVLIALTIIGIIAAITVPALIQRTNKQEYVTALQKAYSTLSQAANMIIAENGSPKCDDGGWACSSENIYNMFKKYLNNIKECGNTTGCIPQKRYKYLDATISKNWDAPQNAMRLILTDGVQVVLETPFKACDGYSGDVCSLIYVDINGAEKPNALGRDFFQLVLKENGLYPSGCSSESCTGTEGWGCACKVLREGAMNY